MRLLVSVVSAQEARRALAGGADIIDVKDPREGALGAPSPRVLSDVVRAVGGAAPVSAALGDLPNLPHTAALAARGAALTGAGYVKVGLRGVRELDGAVALMSAVADAVGPQTAVIAAAYADADALDPPGLAPGWLPELVDRVGISGALVDTFVKDGRGLYGWLSESELADLIARTHNAGASFGVAGQLTSGQLRRVAADVVGVRSAVCRGGDRGADLDPELVAAAVAELRAGSGRAGVIPG
jgi:(5-formylfuran-3-yl)methyl phosphate synthase